MEVAWHNVPRILHRSIVVLLFTVLFLIAISAVFFGFIGYYSRVSLSNELRQNKNGAGVDMLFMSVDQITKDEAALIGLRKRKNELDEKINADLDSVRQSAYSSTEFSAYFDGKSKLIGFFNAHRSRFTDEYWRNIGTTLFKNSPDEFETEVALWTAPVFRDVVTDDERKVYFENLTNFVDAIGRPYRDYNIKYQQPLYQLDLALQRNREPITSEMKAIFSPNPYLATSDDRRTFLDIELPTQEGRQQLAQQRAIIRSFDNLFVGGIRKILEWPTIASTLVVTLATGWLGGLINFMGAAVRMDKEREKRREADIGSLFRRSFLGITAALGVFLAAGSGLLVLTTQNTGAPGASAIELSPYFVAFLAFISGFLADDAFSRLAAGGRKLFAVEGDAVALYGTDQRGTARETA